MDAWKWTVLALLWVGAETQLLGTFVCIFFAAGSAAAAAATWAGLTPAFWQQSALFGGVSAAAMLVLRRRLRRRRAAPWSADLDALVGAEATVLAPLEPGAVGQVEMRGVPWRAQSVAEATLAAGARCWVEQVEGLTLRVGTRGGPGGAGAEGEKR